jgi:small subunit ribosomal protein S19
MSRSKWKGPYFNNTDLETKNRTQTIKKSSTIIPKLVGRSFKVYAGKKFIKISITEEMTGHKIGEFTPTRERFEFKKKSK